MGPENFSEKIRISYRQQLYSITLGTRLRTETAALL
jgi:hypothetical protein